MESETILFELAVYKETEEVYNREFKKKFEKNKYSDSNGDEIFENKMNESIYRDLKKEFGGEWKYNQIIGYLVFYIVHSQINCAYYKGFNKKAMRKGKKEFNIFDDKVSTITLKNSYNNAKIIESINWMIKHCKGQDKFQKRYIDTKIFDNILQFIDWKEYILKLKKGASK